MATSPEMLLAGLGGGSAAPMGPDLASVFAPPPAPQDPGALAPFMTPSGGGPVPGDGSGYVRDTARVLMGDEKPPPEEAIIQKLKPDSELEKKVRAKLNAMYKFGKDEMKKNYARWNYAEQRVQAFTSLNDYEELNKSLEGNTGMPPEPISVIVPYTYATLHAAATFISNVLLGRKPIFPLVGVRGTSVDRARHMEIALQSNLDQSRGQETLWQNIWDSLLYGFGAGKNAWEERTGHAIKWVAGIRQTVNETIFAGNVTTAIDPYSLVPDPRVPMHQCNLRGDFMFCESQQSGTVLKDLEKMGMLKWVDRAIEQCGRFRLESATSENRRRIRIGIRGENIITPSNVVGFYSIREGTVRLVPKDWDLGESDRSELWKFTWVEGQIIQAEPLGMIHNQHPMYVTEPTSLGHDFMSVSMENMIGPFQDILSWLVSSRMENVRVAVNNTFALDPARVEINDVRSSAIGRVIRLKQSAMGLPIKDAIMQLAIHDVTQGHIADIQTMRILADTITGVNDNMRGIQTAGGRRSATEARQSMQAGAGRLQQMAVRISAQGMLPLATQMISNIQQFMPDKMWVELTGDDGQRVEQELSPDMLVGAFNFQISDGSLPYDKMALVEQWKEIMFGIAQEPELRQEYSLSRIFRYVAELGGAKNIDNFKQQLAQPTVNGAPMAASAVFNPQAGGNVPIGPAMPTAPML